MWRTRAGRKLARPELFRLLADASPGDVLLCEQVDRISRLNAKDWEHLKAVLAEKRIRIVSLDLPTSWPLLTSIDQDDFTARMAEAMNSMLLDMLAAISRKDYEDRRRRQAQGQERAKAAGKYKGRPENTARNGRIAKLLGQGASYTEIQGLVGCSRATVAKIAGRERSANV